MSCYKPADTQEPNRQWHLQKVVLHALTEVSEFTIYRKTCKTPLYLRHCVSVCVRPASGACDHCDARHRRFYRTPCEVCV